MDLMDSYQRTEVGAIPADWKGKSLGSVCHKVTTGALDVNAMNPNGQYRFYTCAEKYYFVDTFAFDTEALLVSGNGANVGYVHYYKGKFNAYQRTYVLSSFDISIKYVQHYLSHRLAERIRTEVKASNTPYITRGTLTDMMLFFPPTKFEQDAIAEALSDADAYIESLEQLLAKKRDIKHGAMQELVLGKRRLPGFSRTWTKQPIGDLLTIAHGRSQKAVDDANGVFPILATGGRIGYTNTYLYNKPSVLIGRKGTIDRPQFMDTPFWTVDTLFYSKILGNNDARFLFYRFLLIDWYLYNEASGVPSLNARTIEQIEIEAPDSEEQKAISLVLTDMDRDIVQLELKRDKACAVKQGMMQELLTGRTRLG